MLPSILPSKNRQESRSRLGRDPKTGEGVQNSEVIVVRELIVTLLLPVGVN